MEISASSIIVLLGVTLIAITTTVCGFFLNLTKRSLLSDTLAHALLPGVCLSYLLFQNKASWVLVIGGASTGLISVYFTQYLQRHTKLKPDAAMGVNLGAFFGLGVFLLSLINQYGIGNYAGLENFLFGKAAALQLSDVFTSLIISVVVLSFLWIFRKALLVISFNRELAIINQLPVKLTEHVFLVATAIVLSVAVQSVGVIMVSGLVIIPTVIGRKLSNQLIPVLISSILATCLSTLLGTVLSANFNAISTGPIIIVGLALLLAFVLLLNKKNHAA